jgi:C2 domain/Caleosin related protein
MSSGDDDIESVGDDEEVVARLKQGWAVMVRVIAGRNLANKDLIGKSDGYVHVKLEGTGEEFTTTVIDNNLNPQWGQVFEFYVPERLDLSRVKMTFTVWDKDTIGHDDYLGTVDVVGLVGTQDEKWFELKPTREGREKSRVEGDLLLAWRTQPAALPVDTPYWLLDVEVVEAVGLVGKSMDGTSNPQVSVWMDGWNVWTYQTPPVDKTRSPQWGNKWAFVLAPTSEGPAKGLLKAVVTHFVKTGAGKYLGEIENLDVSALPVGEEDDSWHTLVAAGDNAKATVNGNLHLKVKLYEGPKPPPRNDSLSLHVRFFDIDGDGIITIKEAERAIREMGFSPLLSWLLARLILPLLPSDKVTTLSTGTRHPDAGFFRLADGSFDEEAFEQWFWDSDTDHSGGLSFGEIWDASVKISKNPIVLSANLGEVGALWLLLKDEHGQLSRKKLHDFVTGVFFAEVIASRRQELHLGYYQRAEASENTPLLGNEASSLSAASSSSAAGGTATVRPVQTSQKKQKRKSSKKYDDDDDDDDNDDNDDDL